MQLSLFQATIVFKHRLLMLSWTAATSELLALCLRQSFVVGPKFCGVKMLPPGSHLVSYNAASSGGAELAPTTSFFVHAPARSVVTRRWDAGAELLAELEEEEVTSPCSKFHYICAKRSLRPCRKGCEETARTLRPAPRGQAERYAAGVRRFDFDAGLAPYNLAAHAQWRGLSAHLTPTVLARLSPAQARSQHCYKGLQGTWRLLEGRSASVCTPDTVL